MTGEILRSSKIFIRGRLRNAGKGRVNDCAMSHVRPCPSGEVNFSIEGRIQMHRPWRSGSRLTVPFAPPI